MALRLDTSTPPSDAGDILRTGVSTPVGRKAVQVETDPGIAAPSNVVVPKTTIARSNLGHQIFEVFSGFARPLVPIIMGVMLVGALTPAAHAQVRTDNAVVAPVGTQVGTVRQAQEQFDPAKFTSYPLFKMFWDQPSTQAEGLTNQGEFELTRAGVEKLKAYALSHDLNGREVTSTAISPAATAFMKFLLEHSHYGAFIEQDARPELQRAFGLPVQTVEPLVGEHPVKAGDITIERNVSRYPQSELRGPLVQNLAKMFESEISERRAFFEDPSATPEVKSQRVLGLFADYVSAIRSHGNVDYAETALELLQTKLQQSTFWAVLGTKDFNGAGWSVVESIALGLDPNAFKIDFPNSGVTVPVNYLSMDGSMGPKMKLVDDYRLSMGMDRRAEAFEGKPVLNYLIGQEAGHKKLYLNEAKPFASGVNWGVLLFPNDSEIAGLKPKAGFEFPIDAVDAFGLAFNNNPNFGDKIRVYDAEKRELRVERQIHPAEGDQPATWSAKFFRTDGTEVPPGEVIGLIHNSSGRVKGDGRAAASLDMSFWGYCNVNTAQSVFKASYGIPQLDATTVRVKGSNGQVIEFPKDVAQILLDADIEGLISRWAYVGFAFNNNAQTIRLLDGTSIVGTVADYEHQPGRKTTRDHSDVITVYATPESPFKGSIILTQEGGSITKIKPADIVAVREGFNGAVEIEYKSYGTNSKVKGVPATPISFEGMPVEDGVLRIIVPSPEHPLSGDVSIKRPDGTTMTVPASQIASITGETQNDVRPSDFVAMVSQMNGVFATDASKGPSVSNGARNIRALDTVIEHGAHRPSWAKSISTGIYGPLVRQDGDKMLFRRGTFGELASSSINFSVWHQLDKTGRIINEGWLSGEPDFLWGSIAPLNWHATSQWNPHFPAELRIGLLVNGVSDMDKLASLAKQLNLPENWRDYRTPPAPSSSSQ